MKNHRANNYAFIDSQNLNLGIKSLGWSLNFKKFRIYLCDKYNVKKAYLFIGMLPGNEYLYKYLQEAGYILIFKPTLIIKDKINKKETVKGNVDAELVLHCMIEFNNYDQAVVVSGDGDFHCLYEYLSDQRKLMHILVPNPNKYSALLRKFRDKFVYIDKLEKKLGV